MEIYNKLVRDNIPQKIENNGSTPIIRILSDEEYKIELEKKLYEEYQEVLGAKTTVERIEELADMLEIINSLSKLENKELEDVIECAKVKKLKRGGFDKKIFLESVIDIITMTEFFSLLNLLFQLCKSITNFGAKIPNGR